MPNRVLRDYTDSLVIDRLSAEAERLFIRLIMKADDYGRYHAEPRLLRSGCFPLSEFSSESILGWLKELQDQGIVMLYQSEGKALLIIKNFRQRLKMSRAKFPPPPGKGNDFQLVDEDFPEVPGSSRKFPAESESYSDSEKNPNTKRIPTEQTMEKTELVETGLVLSDQEQGLLSAMRHQCQQRGWEEYWADEHFFEKKGMGWIDHNGNSIQNPLAYFIRFGISRKERDNKKAFEKSKKAKKEVEVVAEIDYSKVNTGNNGFEWKPFTMDDIPGPEDLE